MSGIRQILFFGEEVHTVAGKPDRELITYRIIPAICPEYDLGRFLFPRFPDGRVNSEALPRPELEGLSGEREIFFYHAGLSREKKKVVEKWFFDTPRGYFV